MISVLFAAALSPHFSPHSFVSLHVCPPTCPAVMGILFAAAVLVPPVVSSLVSPLVSLRDLRIVCCCCRLVSPSVFTFLEVSCYLVSIIYMCPLCEGNDQRPDSRHRRDRPRSFCSTVIRCNKELSATQIAAYIGIGLACDR